jgi:hypothetical protein
MNNTNTFVLGLNCQRRTKKRKGRYFKVLQSERNWMDSMSVYCVPVALAHVQATGGVKAANKTILDPPFYYNHIFKNIS